MKGVVIVSIRKRANLYQTPYHMVIHTCLKSQHIIKQSSQKRYRSLGSMDITHLFYIIRKQIDHNIS